jgi:hypothetical protein
MRGLLLAGGIKSPEFEPIVHLSMLLVEGPWEELLGVVSEHCPISLKELFL